MLGFLKYLITNGVLNLWNLENIDIVCANVDEEPKIIVSQYWALKNHNTAYFTQEFSSKSLHYLHNTEINSTESFKTPENLTVGLFQDMIDHQDHVI